MSFVLATAALLTGAGRLAAAQSSRSIVIPFSMAEVALEPSSRFAVSFERNADFLLNLNATKLVCIYSNPANLTTESTCVPYDHPQYYGHYLGHWLSATAKVVEASGSDSAKKMNSQVVAAIGRVQDAWTAIGMAGYVFPYSVIAWDNLFGTPSRNCAPVCVPWYVYHKMLAGLIDSYTRAGNAQALTIAEGMARWAKQAIEGVLASGGEAHWQEVLGTEWGGMNDALYTLGNITGNQDYFRAGYYFNHFSWTSPLAINVDDLTNEHANTHIPEVIGDSKGYELTGNQTQYSIASNFFDILGATREWSTGGSNSGEFWGSPHRLGDGLNADTQESCTSYNMLKLARQIYGWTADPSYFDFYDRLLHNGIIGNQNRMAPFGPETHSTGFIYMLPLGGGGITKPWGSSVDGGFPCCWGTLSEQFASLSDSIYFEATNHATLYINLYVSSTLRWGAQRVGVTQVSGYPNDPAATTIISVAPDAGASPTFTLAIRVPFWVRADLVNVVKLNGMPWTASTLVAGTYFNMSRTWAAGDEVSVLFTPYIRFEQLNDDRPEWQGVGAVLYGSILLAGLTTSDALPLDPASIETAVKRVSETNLTFSTTGSCDGEVVSLIPLADINFEQYTVYFHTGAANASAIGYNASGSSSLPGGGQDFGITAGAGIVTNGPDTNIRSGDPGQTTTASWRLAIQDGSHPVTGLSFAFRYVVGYGPAGAPGGPVISLVATHQCGAGETVLYTSPELTDYPYDQDPQGYSPPVPVYLPRGSISINVTEVTSLELRFVNNRRNCQLLLPLPMTVYWG